MRWQRQARDSNYGIEQLLFTSKSRHSRAGGNPISLLTDQLRNLDSRLRGNDGTLESFY
jgi:hypothetical protein